MDNVNIKDLDKLMKDYRDLEDRIDQTELTLKELNDERQALKREIIATRSTLFNRYTFEDEKTTLTDDKKKPSQSSPQKDPTINNVRRVSLEDFIDILFNGMRGDL